MEGHIVTTQQDKMIDMLLAGENISDIAKILNVARSTIYDWKSRSDIKAELEARREQLKKSAQDKITNDLCTFVDNMKVLANSSTDIRVKFQANKYLIDQGLGSPSTAKEEIKTTTGEGNIDTNTLKKEIDDIRNLHAVK